MIEGQSEGNNRGTRGDKGRYDGYFHVLYFSLRTAERSDPAGGSDRVTSRRSGALR